jgi:hypothetical protein
MRCDRVGGASRWRRPLRDYAQVVVPPPDLRGESVFVPKKHRPSLPRDRLALYELRPDDLLAQPYPPDPPFPCPNPGRSVSTDVFTRLILLARAGSTHSSNTIAGHAI